MDYFIKKENYKGKKPNPGSFILRLQLPKEVDVVTFLFYFVISLYITLSIRTRFIVGLSCHLAR